MSSLQESISFFRQFVSRPKQIGALAPSSRYLARAITTPLAGRNGPINLLEVGAGTGPFTRRIAALLGPNDRFDICEANPELATVLREKFLEHGPLHQAYQAGRIRLFNQYIQDVQGLLRYDFIISGLPFNTFSIRDVRSILELIKRQAKPNCVFSYFEYQAVRDIVKYTRPGVDGKKFRLLSAYLDKQISRYQIDHQTVLMNFLPAVARHMRFNLPVTVQYV